MWKGLIYLIQLIQRAASGRGLGWCSVDSDFMISRPIAGLHGPLHPSSSGLPTDENR